MKVVIISISIPTSSCLGIISPQYISRQYTPRRSVRKPRSNPIHSGREPGKPDSKRFNYHSPPAPLIQRAGV